MDKERFLHQNPYGDTCIIVAESKLQSTRAAFLSSQSLFLQGVIINRAIHRRIVIVDYHKHYLYDYFDDKGEFATPGAENFLGQNDYYRRDIRQKVNARIADIPAIRKLYGYGRFHNYRELRVWLEVILPLFLLLMWALLIFLAFL